MAKNNTLWFPHDYNARNDDKTSTIRAEFGALGYGVFMILIEMLHESEDSRLEWDKKKFARLARIERVDEVLFEKIIWSCIENELFIIEDNFFYSKRVLRNKEEREKLRQQRREAGKIAGQKSAEARAQKMLENLKNEPTVNQPLNFDEPTVNQTLEIFNDFQRLPTTKHNITEQNNKEKKKGGELDSPPTPNGMLDQRKELLKKRAKKFAETLEPFIEIYGKDMINEFWAYWTEPNRSYSKMQFELEDTWEITRRLSKWADRDAKWNKGNRSAQPIVPQIDSEAYLKNEKKALDKIKNM